MKGYALFTLLVAALLLLLPTLALPRATTTAAPTPADTTATASTATTPAPTVTTTAKPTATAPVFKILVGEEVITLDCREFLVRTLAFEMGPSYHAEALKAQAVAAYTYYGRRRLAQEAQPDPTLKGAHFKTPVTSFPQDYTKEKLRDKWGTQFDSHYNKLAAAVDAVMGRYITHNGEWIDACYFAISGGQTESAAAVWGADVPYLRSVPSPADKLAPGYETAVTLSADAVRAALTKLDPTLTLGDDPAAWFGTPTKTAAGSVKTLPVGGKPLSGTSLRTALGLRAANFTLQYTDGGFCITTRGYGHGVGMSQYGADTLARQGMSWQEILQHYYTGITIV